MPEGKYQPYSNTVGREILFNPFAPQMGFLWLKGHLVQGE